MRDAMSKQTAASCNGTDHFLHNAGVMKRLLFVHAHGRSQSVTLSNGTINEEAKLMALSFQGAAFRFECGHMACNVQKSMWLLVLEMSNRLSQQSCIQRRIYVSAVSGPNQTCARSVEAGTLTIEK